MGAMRRFLLAGGSASASPSRFPSTAAAPFVVAGPLPAPAGIGVMGGVGPEAAAVTPGTAPSVGVGLLPTRPPRAAAVAWLACVATLEAELERDLVGLGAAMAGGAGPAGRGGKAEAAKEELAAVAAGGGPGRRASVGVLTAVGVGTGEACTEVAVLIGVGVGWPWTWACGCGCVNVGCGPACAGPSSPGWKAR